MDTNATGFPPEVMALPVEDRVKLATHILNTLLNRDREFVLVTYALVDDVQTIQMVSSQREEVSISVISGIVDDHIHRLKVQRRRLQARNRSRHSATIA